VTKKEIVRIISEETGLPQLKIKEIVQKTFETIIETLVKEGRIELRNFGVFEVKLRAARQARNPKTDMPVQVAERYVVKFKPGKEMEAKVAKYHAKSAAPVAPAPTPSPAPAPEPIIEPRPVEETEPPSGPLF
jgi:integration host factor subunit beta